MDVMSDQNTPGEVTAEDIKQYYGKTLLSSKDCKTDVSSHCPLTSSVPQHVKRALAEVHEEVSERYLGCGLVIPPHVEGVRILDLGSGSGRDCYALSKLVGENGHVTGIDMTEDMIEASSKFITYHQKKFGYSKPNVEFVLGYMENLEAAGIKPASLDVIVSNCVITLCPDKKAVFREAYKALKDGGEMFISDMYADRTVPDHLRKNKVLYGEGLGGALNWKDLLTIARDIGFSCPRLVDARIFEILDKQIQEQIKGINYVAATYRLVKLPRGVIHQPCHVTYLGNVEGYQDRLKIDAELTFQKGQRQLVDSTVAAILKTSRFKSCFQFDQIKTPTPVDPVELGQKACRKTKCKAEEVCAASDEENARQCSETEESAPKRMKK